MLISNGISFSGGVTITAPIPITYLTDPYYYNTVLHLNGETPTPIWISDASTVTNAITTSGNVVPSRFSPILPQGYYSNQFDGSTGYLTAPANAAFSFGTGDFTVELWAYIGAVSNTNGKMMIDSRPANTNGSYWNFGLNATGVAGFTSMTTGGTTINATSAYPNQWVHYAATRQGTSLRLFVNGVLVASATDSSNISSSGLFIGTNAFYSSATDTYWSGYMSNIRIIKGTALYTSNFTPSTVPLTAATSQTSLLTCLGPSFTDYANNFPITVAGTVKVQTFQPFGALPSTVSNPTNGYYSNYFNGSSYFGVASLPIFAFGTNNFTVEVWVNLTSFTNVRFIEGITGTGGLELSFNSTGNVTWGKYGVGNILTSTTPITLNTWYHVAVVRSASITAIYINGVASGFIGDTYSYPQTAIRVGADAGPTYYFNGQMSNLRIVNGTALYTNNFTVPSQPLTVVNSTQTSLLTSLNQQLSDASGYANTLTNSGVVVTSISPFTVPTTSTAITALGSGQFDGSSGYLTIPASTSTIVGTKDFTIEFWVYPTIAPSTSWNAYFSMGASGGGQEIRISQNMNGGGFGFLIPNNASSADSYAGYGTLVLNQWHHLAVVRYGSVVTIYRNGTAAGSLTGVTFNYTNTGSILVGADKYPVDGYTGGYVSNVRIVSGAAVYTSNFAPSNQPLTVATNTTGTTVLLTLQNRQSNNNNTFYDDSPNNFAITRAGTPTQGSFTPFSQNGWSNYFDGSTGYLTVPTGVLVFGTNNFTVECWVYTSSYGGSSGEIAVDNWVTAYGSYTTGQWQLWISSTGVLSFSYTTGSSAYTPIGTGTVPLYQWTHIAAVRNGNTLTTYINGAASGSGNLTVSSIGIAGSSSIGRQTVSNSYFWNGHISNLRVVNGTALYTSTFTPPTLALTTATGTTGTVSLLTAQSNRFLDNSTYSNTLTVSGSVQVIPYSPFANQSLVSNSYSTTLVGGSVYFNGSTDYITVAGTSAFAFGSVNDFTIEFWAYPSPGTSGVVYDQRSGSGDVAPLIYLYTNGWTFGYAGVAAISAVGGYVTGQWIHVALVRKSNITKLYINGTQAGSNFTDTNNYICPANHPLIGQYGNLGGSYFAGYISNMRVINGYAVYTSNFTPPTAPLQPIAPITVVSTSTSTIASTSLLLLGTNSGIVDQTGRNDLISVGTATISASTFKYGAGSIYIPGTGNYLQTTGTRYWIPTGLLTFTIEAWIYMTQLPTGSYPGMVGDMAIGGTDYLSFGPISTGALQLYWFPGGSVAVTGNTIMSTSTWNHIAVSVNAGAIGLFVNGVNQTLTGTTTLSARSGTVNYLTVGQSGSLQYYGYIDDLRITQGVARYSTGTNFTLPSVQPVQ